VGLARRSGLFAFWGYGISDLCVGVSYLPEPVGVIMPRFVIKVEKHGSRLRVTIPKVMVAELGLEHMAYALGWGIPGGKIILVPFIDEAMLNEAISGDPTVFDPGSEKP